MQDLKKKTYTHACQHDATDTLKDQVIQTGNLYMMAKFNNTKKRFILG